MRVNDAENRPPNGLSGEVSLFYVGSATYSIDQSFSALAPFGVSVPPVRVGSYNLLNRRIGCKFWHQKAEVDYMRDAEVASPPSIR
jgi:hypothetical protein